MVRQLPPRLIETAYHRTESTQAKRRFVKKRRENNTKARNLHTCQSLGYQYDGDLISEKKNRSVFVSLVLAAASPTVLD